MSSKMNRTHTQTHKPQKGEPLLKKMNIILVYCIAVSYEEAIQKDFLTLHIDQHWSVFFLSSDMISSLYSVLLHGLGKRKGSNFLRGVKFVSNLVQTL